MMQMYFNQFSAAVLSNLSVVTEAVQAVCKVIQVFMTWHNAEYACDIH